MLSSTNHTQMAFNGAYRFELADDVLSELSFMAHLEDTDGNQLPGCILLRQEGRSLVVDVYPPGSGLFEFKLFGRSNASTKPSYECLLAYLVRSTGIATHIAPFRAIFNYMESHTGAWGWQDLQPLGVTDCSWKDWLKLDTRTRAEETLSVQMSSMQDLDYHVTAQLASRSHEEEGKRTDCCWVTTSDKEADIHFRPWRADVYVLRIWARVPGTTASFHTHATFVVDSRQAACADLRFPIVYSAWSKQSRLVSPLVHTLKPGSAVDFEAVVPGLKGGLVVRVGGDYIPMQRAGDRYTLTATMVSGPCYIYASTATSTGKSYKGLVGYECE